MIYVELNFTSRLIHLKPKNLTIRGVRLIVGQVMDSCSPVSV